MGVVVRDPAWDGNPVDWLSNAVSRQVEPSCTQAGRGEGEPQALLKLWRLLESSGGVRDSPGVNNEPARPQADQTTIPINDLTIRQPLPPNLFS